MTRPIYEPSLQRTDRRLTYSADQLFRRPAPRASGLGFATIKTNNIEVDDNVDDRYIVDFDPAGPVQFASNTDEITGIYHDTGKTPDYGIFIPQDTLARVTTWLTFTDGGTADGSHNIGWIIDGGYSYSEFGPSIDAAFMSSAGSATGLADDRSLPDGLYHIAYLGSSTEDFVVGAVHDWQGWTTFPQFFKYGIIVEPWGAFPTN